MTHHLKIKELYYDQIASGEKKFEVRYNDRDYQVGDTIVLNSLGKNGGKIQARIGYIHSGLGLADGYVILGIEVYIEEKKWQ